MTALPKSLSSRMGYSDQPMGLIQQRWVSRLSRTDVSLALSKVCSAHADVFGELGAISILIMVIKMR